MGYSITLWSSDLSIPKENWDAAFNAVCELNEHDELAGIEGESELLCRSRDCVDSPCTVTHGVGFLPQPA